MMTIDHYLVSQLEKVTTGMDVHTVKTVISLYHNTVHIIEMNDEENSEKKMHQEYLPIVETSIRKIIHGADIKKESKSLTDTYIKLKTKHNV